MTSTRLLPALLLTITLALLCIDSARRATVAVAAPGDIATYAGGGVGDGGGATNAAVSPYGVAVDGAGNTYIADGANCRVRKVAAGVVTTVAGTGICGYGGDGGPATAARVNFPHGVAVDTAGDVYIADTENCRIRKVSGGVITTFAGTGLCIYGGDGGAATSASLDAPRGVAIDNAAGIVYIADTDTCRVRQVAAGVITTVAGNGLCGYGGDGGPAASARLSHPWGVGVDPGGALYIADTSNCRVRIVVFPSTNIFTVAGNGACTYGGDGGSASSASLNKPRGVATDAAGDVYIADTQNCRIRKVSYPFVSITTVAGSAACGYGGDGGAATSAQLNMPQGVVLGGSVLRIADTANCRVRDVSGGTILTVAGTGGCSFGGDGGAATNAAISSPADVAVDGAGNLYIADTANCRIRKVTAGGVISTIAGNGTCTYSGDGGPAELAALDGPRGVAVDAAGNVYIADSGSCRIRRRDAATGNISTIAGNGTCGYGGDIGPATSAMLNFPQSVAVTTTGIIYIADTFNCRIRRVVTTTITTAAGTGTCSYSGDGGSPLSATLTFPYGVAVDAAGNAYIADTLNCRVRKLTGGTINLVAGNGACAYGGDSGPATAASLGQPVGLAVTASGSVYIADTNNCRVRLVAGTTIISVAGAGTGVGFAGCGFAGDGGPAAAALLNRPQDVAVDAAGNVYVSDWLNNRVRLISAGSDIDADGDVNAADNCPTVTNGGQENNDRNFTDLTPPKANDDLTWPNSDVAGDACDPDDDNDGRLDADESIACNGGAATNPLLRDTDGDRRLDGAECANGSDPADPASVPASGCTLGTSPDTDGDGLRDALETCFYNSNISSTNTDGDACGDAREVMSMDNNTVVNAADLGLTASAFGTYGTPPTPGNEWRMNMDVDKNGTVNAADLGLVASKFGACP